MSADSAPFMFFPMKQSSHQRFIRQRSGDTFLLQAGTLYPVLHGLEAKGCITSQEQIVEQGRARRFYSITETGLKQLALQKNQWDAFRRAVERTMEE